MVNRNKKSCIGNLFYVSIAVILMHCDRIESEMKGKKIIPDSSMSFTPSKLANSCCVSISAILILLFFFENQASSFGCEEMFSIWKKRSCKDYDKKYNTDDRWWFLSRTARRFILQLLWFLVDEIGWILFFIVFLKHFLVFCWLFCFEILRFESELILISLLLSN